jgi:hypothetical protein
MVFCNVAEPHHFDEALGLAPESQNRPAPAPAPNFFPSAFKQ